MAVIETSRGCPFDCGYCFWGGGKRKIQYFPIERVLKDIEILYNNPKVKQVCFADSNLFSNSNRAEIILNHIINQKSHAKTYYESDIIDLTQDIAILAAKLTDSFFFLSIQTTNPEALKLIDKKRVSPEIFAQMTQALKQWVPAAKIKIDVMLGLPGDTFEKYIQTLDFVLQLEPHYLCLNYPIYLLPGSRFYETRKSLGIKHTSNPPLVIIETPTFPKENIEKALRFSIWVQILTYYYPAIAQFFYSVARIDNNRTERLFSWIAKIENELDLFSIHESLSHIAINSSLDKWNKTKKAILEKASEIRSSFIIYSAIGNIEISAIHSDPGKNIISGKLVFEYMLTNKVEIINDETCHTLANKLSLNNGLIDIKHLFSIYIKYPQARIPRDPWTNIPLIPALPHIGL
jgi:radical SAM superfamily enzyme YgiQ (UPF0313 family)